MTDNDDAVMYIVVSKHHQSSLAQLLSDGATAVCNVLAEYGSETAHRAAFDAWRAGIYRKVTLRANEKELEALSSFPSCKRGDVAVFPPVRRSDRPKALARLQTYNAEVEDLRAGFMAPAGDDAWIVVNPDVLMSVGKMLAQVGHAAMLAFEAKHDPTVASDWRRHGFRCTVTFSGGEEWSDLARDNAAGIVTDAGLTEIDRGTQTCLAVVMRRG